MIHGFMGPMGFFPFGLVGGLAGLLFFAGLVVLAIWLFREIAGTGTTQSGPAAPSGRGETPLDILSRRFASGEIGAEEFQKVRDLLKGS